ncbi:uncharacterized protein LOC129271469 [Lytechinus pictus]|uniref:uncharacterized protein LOC129271469 n=1 Tax=Lytechinus pictus TaxID=7653 RepID=UPI00240D40A5|nr:uncharacterized protein LOC129271469 [Lytechinus pictus]
MNTTPWLNASNYDVDANLATSPMSANDADGGGESRCQKPLFITKNITLAIATSLMVATLILIPCHRRLRRQHHIFPYNLVLADFSGAVSIIMFSLAGDFEIPGQAEKFLVILLATSTMVSLLSVVLVTGYQFITIRVDPFGSRNIITTRRLILTCMVTWAIGFICSSPIAVINDTNLFIALLSISYSTTIATGLAYLFIYRSVAQVPCGGSITQERKDQNQRVLRTFGMVFGTTVLCWICPWVTWTRQILGHEEHCLITISDIMINVNWIANGVIYWWRLKDFRLIFGFCRKQRGSIDPELSLVTELK